MRNKFCLRIVYRELAVNRKRFCFYWMILFLLLTVTITILEAERVIPDMISRPVSSMQADRIIFEINAPSELETILGNVSYTVYDCSLHSGKLSGDNLSLHKQGDSSDFDRAFLLNRSQPDSQMLCKITEHLLEGVIAETESDSIFLSEQFGNTYNLRCGDIVIFRISDTVISKLRVAGIYSDFTDCRAFYLSEDVYGSYREQIKNSTLQVTVAPVEFRDIFRILSALNEKKINCLYSTQTVNALSMLYFLFTAMVIVLLIALFSILSNLLQFYYMRRKRFFAINIAIGMNSRASMKVLGFTAEAIVLLAFLPAGIMADFFINWMNHFTGELFGFPVEGHFISIYTLLIAFVTVQADVVFVLIKFFRKIDTFNIISAIREN